MNLQTVDIPRKGARSEAASYARAARTERNPRRRAELEQMARAYRIVAATTDEGLIALTPTIVAGGTVTRTLVNRFRGEEHRTNYLLPKLAVCRAEAAFCYTLGITRDGRTVLTDSLERRWTYRSGVVSLDTRFEFPAGYMQGALRPHTSWQAWTAMVPIVPPRLRPARGLASRLVLWEVDDWAWQQVPRPPGDPALLRHVAGDIYAVEAVWDLTELERLVLAGRRLEG